MRGRERYGSRDLNKTELRVVELGAQGLKNSEVAEIIGATEMVIKNYLRVIYDKLGFWNRVELALWYEARRHELSTLALWPPSDASNIVVPRTPGNPGR